ncbi:hypothetical protein H634G_04852 [Metarhizium anisopliae BRIP 53293]|uniref:CID domain-containing protein n=1 Tax=Metarhizium anisopliae BRIP 53293 TaxID=1291518 RepID=A0A0D9P3C7_METAN|nr:hypothetical protein H634G_04852 [Metarhizium anisopliae BRIP 53293]KJK94713.1 hypothetical protein H633G_01429 [Metarhizium anisopliae BRIP 53284]
MATPELTIAKAALSASLFRADPASISRPSVDTFFQQVTSTLTQCSRPNVQTCKDYILSNIIHSSGRSTALAKYLVALSNAQVDDAAHPRPSTKRRRLHVLYIVNDVLYHAARQGNQDFRTTVEAYLPPLISAAASFEKCPKHIKKLQDLVSIWKSKQYTSDAVIPKLQEALAGSTVSATPEPVNTSLKLAKEAPFILPSFHGDASTAWYDLPAATWLPHLVPNSTKPMLPDLIRPIQLAPGPADNVVTAAVKALLSDAERIFSRDRRPDDDAHIDLNEMGERIVLDEITGEVIGGETYYGWSRRFCERMKDRKKGKQRGRSESQSSARSYSRSRRSSSRSFKRRRMSPSRSRSRSRSRSYTPRSASRSRSRSRSRTRSRRRSYSSSPHRSSPKPSPQPTANPNMPFNMPIPPLPAGYTGPWPPPPPPLPPQGWMPDPTFAAQMMGVWNGQAPPPPPPTTQAQAQYNNYNQRGGYDGFRGRGRGYYRGGGRGYNRGR